MVQRQGSDIIVPIGDTLLLEDDKVIMIKIENTLEFAEDDETDKNSSINGLER